MPELPLHWPTAGLNEKLAYDQQPPYSTPSCQDVQPGGLFEQRKRGGQRPGLSKLFDTQLGGGKPVRLLAPLPYVDSASTAERHLADDFESSSLGSAWTAASWDSLSAPTIARHGRSAASGTGSEVGAVLDAISNIDTSSDYEVSILIVPYQGRFHGVYRIYLKMDDTTPDASDEGIQVEIETTGIAGDYTGKVIHRTGGTPTTVAMTSGSLGRSKPGWLRVLVSVDDISVTWQGTSILGATTISGFTSKRVGFGMKAIDGQTLIDTFTVSYVDSTGPELLKQKLAAVSNGKVYLEGRIGTISQVGSADIVGKRQLQAVHRGGALYIADYDTPVDAETDGDITSSVLTSATVGTWTGVDQTQHGVEIYDADDAAFDGFYNISSVSGTDITLDPAPGGSSVSCSFRVIRGVKKLDPVASTVAIAAAGTPVGCRLIARYRDRIVLAGSRLNPHAWWMSKQFDPDTWEEDETVASAVVGTNSSAGVPGEPITSLMTWSDDFLVFGCTNSIWLLVGDPMFRGELSNLSHDVGVVDANAWCRTPTGALVFLSQDGLYILNPRPGAKPDSLSREALPDELRNLDTEQAIVTLEHSLRRRGVHVYVTYTDSRPTKHWWFDLEQPGFWPIVHDSDHDPHSACRYHSELASESFMAVGCRDGYIRCYRLTAEDDDGTKISSQVHYGPFRLGGRIGREGILTTCTGALATGSGPVTVSCIVARDHLELLDQTADVTFNMTAETNRRYSTRRRGVSCLLKLAPKSSIIHRAWVIDDLLMNFSARGMLRV